MIAAIDQTYVYIGVPAAVAVAGLSVLLWALRDRDRRRVEKRIRRTTPKE